MKLQGDRAARFAQKPDPACRCVLIFGDDEGVVGDTAGALIKAWEKEGPTQVLTLDEDEVKRHPATLFDALEAQSLLGEATILRVRTKGEKLFSILKDVLAIADETPDRIAGRLIVMNGGLNTRSKLRTAFEAARHGAALHVFADSAGDMASRVEASLSEAGLQIEPEALALFVGGLPGHRSLANAELEKLSLYAADLGRAITQADIRGLCETNSDQDARVAVQRALEGDAAGAQAELDRLLDATFSAISLVRMFEMEATRMMSAHALGGGDIGMKLKPPVWKSDWPAFQARLRLWPVPRLLRLIERLNEVETLAKSPGGAGLADAAARELFVSLYDVASKARARRA